MVEIAKGGVDYVSAPADYAAFFRQYRSYVITLVKKVGIDPQHAEDVASEIMLRFMERDFLKEFDPTLTFVYQGEIRPARFKSFLSRFVLIYARGHRDKQLRQMTRELLLVDSPQIEDGTSWMDGYQTVPGADEDVLGRLAEGERIAEVRAYLSTIPKRSRFDTCDLIKLFEQVLIQLREKGYEKPNVSELQRHFAISSTAAHSWLWWLRSNIATALGRPLPAKRVRATTRTAS